MGRRLAWIFWVGIEAGIHVDVSHGERSETVGPISRCHPHEQAHPPVMDPTGKPWGTMWKEVGISALPTQVGSHGDWATPALNRHRS